MGEAIANESLPPRGRGTTKWWKEPAGAVKQNSFHRNAFSLSRLRRQLPPGGSLTA